MGDTERRGWERDRREATDGTRHEYYEPLGLLTGDQVKVTLTGATRSLLGRWVPDRAEALWERATTAGPRMASMQPQMVQFLRWDGPADPEGFCWPLLGEYDGQGKHHYDEDYAPGPFGEDALLVFGYGFVAPEDVTHVKRVLGYDTDPGFDRFGEGGFVPLDGRRGGTPE